MFELPPDEGTPSRKIQTGDARPRLRTAQRDQVRFRAASWNELLPDDHQARNVREFVERLDLTELLRVVNAVDGSVGRNSTDPKLLMTLRSYATLRGIGSARELARRCETDLPYQWICGDVTVNHHLLADFRTQHLELLDRLLTESMTTLLAANSATLDRVAQDGVKVRASAGAGSFRREPTLERLRTEAEEQLRALRKEADGDRTAGSARQRAARQRAARERAVRERAERVAQALELLPEIREKKEPKKRDEARVSTTDPEARAMKMADGGYRPAYNVQFVTDPGSQCIVGVAITNAGNDFNESKPMLEQLEARYGRRPGEVLVDGGYVSQAAITGAAAGGTKVYAPVPDQAGEVDPHARERPVPHFRIRAALRDATGPATNRPCGQARTKHAARFARTGFAPSDEVCVMFLRTAPADSSSSRVCGRITV